MAHSGVRIMGQFLGQLVCWDAETMGQRGAFGLWSFGEHRVVVVLMSMMSSGVFCCR